MTCRNHLRTATTSKEDADEPCGEEDLEPHPELDKSCRYPLRSHSSGSRIIAPDSEQLKVELS